MLIREYAAFVSRTDQFTDRTIEERKRIAIYGLSSEIGSIVSAVKKERLKEGGALNSELAKDELRDEIGDVIWYCFILSQIENVSSEQDILEMQISRLANELEDPSERGIHFRDQLEPEKLAIFLAGAKAYPSIKRRSFDEFQALAFNTARTQENVLLDVCLSVLTQLAAQLMRHFLTTDERKLNTEVKDAETMQILGEVAWHLAALASLYKITLGDIVQRNRAKIEYRQPDGVPTVLHDLNDKPSEQFPRQFEIKFITVAKGRSRMYWNGIQLGNELTDNAEPDGYRFHDVVHLANIAHLGWSPVMRSLMRRKRKTKEDVDEIQDGARAKIVEEAIVKLTHSEGVRQAEILQPGVPPEGLSLFADGSDVSFTFLRQLRSFTRGLDVHTNKLWEWKNAIHDGFAIYRKLCRHHQGTVSIDMDARTISFSPHVYIDIVGAVSGVGSCAVDIDPSNSTLLAEATSVLTPDEAKVVDISDMAQLLTIYTAKKAILQAIGIDHTPLDVFHQVQLHLLNDGKFSVDARGDVQKAYWKRGIVATKTSVALSQSSVYCTALAVCDPAPK